jgi:hypothetical protein
LNSELYAADYDEVRVLGSRANTNRTPEQADSAQIRETGEDWTMDIYAQHPLPLLESARRDALFWMAGMDAQIHLSDAKWTYSFWRPITAIREGANDGNAATVGDPAWTPFLDTHPHPEYPSALVATTAALSEVLVALHGDNFSFNATSGSPVKTRTFARLSDYVQDGIIARLVGGTHFRNSCNAGAQMGRQIAQHAFQNFLRPIPSVSAGTPLNPGEFQLFLNTGRSVPYVIERSGDLVQWSLWQTNIYGTILHLDTNAAATDRQFYRALLGNP